MLKDVCVFSICAFVFILYIYRVNLYSRIYILIYRSIDLSMYLCVCVILLCIYLSVYLYVIYVCTHACISQYTECCASWLFFDIKLVYYDDLHQY